MSIDQAELTRLLRLGKLFEKEEIIEFPMTTPFEQSHGLAGTTPHHREKFMLYLHRSKRLPNRLGYATVARGTVQLARMDINGKPHTNPENAPHRPGHRFVGTHLHVYDATHGDAIAYYPHEVAGFKVPDAEANDVDWLMAFLEFCAVLRTPMIQQTI